MTLDKYCEIYMRAWKTLDIEEARRRFEDFNSNFGAELSQRFTPLQTEDIEWFKHTLEDDIKNKFVAHVFFRTDIVLPEELYEPMLRAAVYEIDPSYNRYFVEPCIEAFGLRRVNNSLIEVVRNGDNFEKAGAVNALYWAMRGLAFQGIPPAYTKEYALPESVQAYEALEDVWMFRDCLFLKEFVNNPNLEVRQNLIPFLKLDDPAYFPEDLRPLVNEAIRIAENHEDEYIRHRVGIQLHKDPPRTKPPYNTLMAKPYRKRKSSDE